MSSVQDVYYILSSIAVIVTMSTIFIHEVRRTTKNTIKEEIEPLRDQINSLLDILVLYLSSEEDSKPPSKFRDEIIRKLTEIKKSRQK